MRLSRLALLAAFDILSDVSADSWPPVVPCDKFQSFVPSRVSRKLSIVMHSDDLASKLIISRNVDSTLPCDDTVVFIPVRKSLFQCILSYSLEILSSFTDVREDCFGGINV